MGLAETSFHMDMVHNNPGEKPYITKYNAPVFLKEQGFNGAVTHWHINCAIIYDHLWKEWNLLKQSSPWCATLYTDMAFRNQTKGNIGELVNVWKRRIYCN